MLMDDVHHPRAFVIPLIAVLAIVGSGLLLILSTARAKDVSQHAIAQSVTKNQTNLCALSQKRWVVQHDVIVRLSLPVQIAPGTDPITVKRLRLYNSQQAMSRTYLLGELGPKPSLC